MKNKEEILKELKNRPRCKNWELDDNKFYWDIDDKEIEKLLIKAIDQTREETIRDIEKNIKLKPTGYLLMSGQVSEDEIDGYEKFRQDVLEILNKLKK